MFSSQIHQLCLIKFDVYSQVLNWSIPLRGAADSPASGLQIHLRPFRCLAMAPPPVKLAIPPLDITDSLQPTSADSLSTQEILSAARRRLAVRRAMPKVQ